MMFSVMNKTDDIDEMICIASTNDGPVTASGVIDVIHGNLNLALPENNEETDVSIKCIQYNVESEREVVARAFSEKISYRPLACDKRSFQPGYYDNITNLWHDACSGNRPIELIPVMREEEGPAQLNADNCPMLADIQKDIWVSFIGDSVTRQFIINGLSGIMGDRACRERNCNVPKNVASWQTHRNNVHDWMLVAISDPQRQYKIWLSYTFDFIIGEGETEAARHFDKPFTWGDFMRLRNDGPRDDDPQFPPEKSPDIVFYSGGYHASKMTAQQYGAAIEEALHQYQGALKEHNVPMPQFHLMLNMMVS